MAKPSTEKSLIPSPPAMSIAQVFDAKPPEPQIHALREALDVRERDGHTEFVVVLYADGLCEERVVASTRDGITAPEVGNQYRLACLRKAIKPMTGALPDGGDLVIHAMAKS